MEISEHEVTKNRKATRAIWAFLGAVFAPKTSDADLAEVCGRDFQAPATINSMAALRELHLARHCSLGSRRSL